MEISDLAQSFQSIVGGLQTLTSLTRKAEQQGLNDEFTKEFNSAVINMQSAVMDAQSMTLESQGEQSRLLARIAGLEEKVKQSDEWIEEKMRYELVSLGDRLVYGVREYSRKENEAGALLVPNLLRKWLEVYLTALRALRSREMPDVRPHLVEGKPPWTQITRCLH